MAKLYFKVFADYEKVIKLRQEIDRLKETIKTASPNMFPKLENELKTNKKELTKLTEQASEAGTKIEKNFKSRIFDSSKEVNNLTEKIIKQKTVIKDIEGDIVKLSNKYKELGNYSPKKIFVGAELSSAKRALQEEKSALNGLQTKQAEARLSTKRLRDEYALYKDDVLASARANFSFGKSLAVVGGASMITGLISKLIQVRGEFRNIEVTLTNMVGAEKAQDLLKKLKEFAAISPLNFKDISSAAQMMSGFNIDTDKIPRYIQALGDISQGNSQKFSSLALAFSQMSAAGKLMGQDLNQMINAGFNPLQTISEKTGKSIATFKEEMSQGTLSANMIQQAFIDATSEGGKFYNMSQNSSKELSGQISMLGDAIDNAFNGIGKQTEGVLMGGTKSLTYLVENYETVGKVLVGLIGTYGMYRTAIMLASVAESKHTIIEIGLTNIRILARKVQLALNAAMLTNPYVAIAVAVGATATAMWALHDSTTAAEKAQKRFNERKEKTIEKEKEEKTHLENLISTLQEETSAQMDRVDAMEQIKTLYPTLFQKYIDEKGHVTDLITLWKEYNELQAEKRVGKNKQDYEELKSTTQEQGRYLYLYDNPDKRKNLGEQDIALWRKMSQKPYNDIAREFKQNSADLKLLEEQVMNDNRNSWQISLKKDTDEKIARTLSEYERYKKSIGTPFKQNNSKPNEGFTLDELISGNMDDREVDKRMTIIKAEKESREKQGVDQNKKYWEGKKKEAQDKLDALTDIQAKGKEGEKLKVKISKYDTKLESYSTTNKANKQLSKVDVKDTSSSDLLSEEIRLENEVAKSRIKTMQNGFPKVKATIDQQKKEELQNLESWYQKELNIIIEKQKKIYQAKSGSLKGFEVDSSSTDIQRLDTIKNSKSANINQESEQAMQEYLDGILDKYKGYFESRKDMKDKYENDEKVILKSNATDSEKESALEILYAEKEKALGIIDNEFAMKDEYFEQWSSAIIDLSMEKLDILIAKAEEEIRTLEEKGDSDPQKIAKARASLNVAKDVKRTKEAKSDVEEDLGTGNKKTDESIKRWDRLRKSLNKTKKEFDEIGESIGGTAGEALKAVGTISTSTISIIDGIKTLTNSAISGTEGAAKSAASAIRTVESASVILTIISAAMQIVMKMVEIFGKQKKLSQETIDQYDDFMEVTDDLINQQKDLLETISGVQAIMTSRKAIDILNDQITATKNLGKEYLNTGQSAGSHSYGYRTMRMLQDYRKELSAIGIDISKFGGRAEGIFDLSAEQLKKWKEGNIESWAKLDDSVRKYLQTIIDSNKEIEEVTEALKESMTNLSLDQVKEDFKDFLSDIDISEKDYADNFGEYMRQAIIKNLVDGDLKNKIKSWYDKFSTYMSSDNKLTEEEKKDLQDEYMNIAKNAKEERDKLFEAAGIPRSSSSSQSATSGGSETMNQETGSELNGRFTDIQMTTRNIDAKVLTVEEGMKLLNERTEKLCASNYDIRNIADEIRTIQVDSYLELKDISKNTGTVVAPIQQIASDMRDVKEKLSTL